MSTKKEIVTSEAPAPVVAYSQGLIVQDKFVYTSGQIAIDPSTGKLIDGSLQDRVVCEIRDWDQIGHTDISYRI
jgi:enamine deaminase RidA (YjgF/YER057c/UK114 family)